MSVITHLRKPLDPLFIVMWVSSKCEKLPLNGSLHGFPKQSSALVAHFSTIFSLFCANFGFVVVDVPSN
jgi:hypothetical protein